MTRSLAVVIVHYGLPQPTLDCVESLLRDQSREEQSFLRIVVVSNALAVETETLRLSLERLQDEYACDAEDNAGARVLLLGNGRNLGFAAACNVGMHAACREPETRFLWLLNNDTQVRPGTPRALLKHCREHPGDVVGATILCMDKPEELQLACGCRLNPWTSVVASAHAGAALSAVTSLPEPDMDYVYGASLCLSRELFESTGGLCEDYFLYYEEADFCRRARAMGAGLSWCREALVEHADGGSTGRRPPASLAERTARRELRILSHYHENRSTLLYLKRHHPMALITAVPIRIAAKLVLLPLRGEAWLLPGLFRTLDVLLPGRG